MFYPGRGRRIKSLCEVTDKRPDRHLQSQADQEDSPVDPTLRLAERSGKERKSDDADRRMPTGFHACVGRLVTRESTWQKMAIAVTGEFLARSARGR